MKMYDRVKAILKEDPALRNSDKKLIWKVWLDLGLITNHYGVPNILKDDFMKAPSTETIRRTRQKVQQHNVDLRASEQVQDWRKQKTERWTQIMF